MTSHPIHIFNGFRTPYGGSEQEALLLRQNLSQHACVQAWASSSRADSALLAAQGIKRIEVLKRQAPQGGTYIFVGSHWRNKLWPYLIPKPSRLIYVYNTFHPKLLELTQNMPRLLGWPKAEFVVISEYQKQRLGIEAEVHPSPINLEAFTPAAERPCNNPALPIRVGRMSRDTLDKHSDEDVTVYRKLAEMGVEIWLQGATCIQDRLPSHPNIKILPIGKVPASEFLQNLNILYYRTGDHVETFGRVVFEAMACGIPVVCHRRGGYVEHIQHQNNGLLFDTTEEALTQLTQLINSQELRNELGRNGRTYMRQLFGEIAAEERLAFYLLKPPN